MRIAIALPPDLGGRVLSELKAHGHDAVLHAASGADLAASVARLGVDVALTSARVGYLSATLLAACDGAGVRLVSLVESPAERAAASNLGLAELVDATASWDELHAMLTATPWSHLDVDATDAPGSPAPSGTAAWEAAARTTTARGAAARGETGRGEVIAVWGPAGAPGRTSLAINIAAELAAQGHSVTLADADTHGGAIAPSLGLLDEAPGFAAACRLAGTGGLNHSELERVGQRYLSGHGSFWVLTGIGRPSRWPEVSAERVDATIEQCRTFADFTVIDTGFSLENDEEISSDVFAPRRNAATLSALRAADRVIAVGVADPVGLSRFLRGHVDLLDIVDPERVNVVINKVRASVVGTSPGRQITQTLQRFAGIDDVTLVPHELAAFDAALLAGRTLREGATRSTARLAISALVTERILQPGVDTRTAKFRMPFAPRSRAVQPSS